MSYAERTLDELKAQTSRIDDAATRLAAQLDAGELHPQHHRRMAALTQDLLETLRRLRLLAQQIEQQQ